MKNVPHFQLTPCRTPSSNQIKFPKPRSSLMQDAGGVPSLWINPAYSQYEPSRLEKSRAVGIETLESAWALGIRFPRARISASIMRLIGLGNCSWEPCVIPFACICLVYRQVSFLIRHRSKRRLMILQPCCCYTNCPLASQFSLLMGSISTFQWRYLPCFFLLRFH